MKIIVYNLGCKVNQYESDSIILRLSELGYDVGTTLGYADAYILNTCAVTNEAERKSRQAVTRCRKYNDKAIIIVCGCASQNDFKPFVDKLGVSYISGVAGKAKLPDMLRERGVFVEELPTRYEDTMTAGVTRTRAYVKVQDGCNNFCSYCIIPYLRGRSRSRDISGVVAECNGLAKQSREIVVTGINLSAYGEDNGSSLCELIQSLTEVDARIRLGSLEVNVITDELLVACSRLPKFCPQFHLSLQSGSDGVLAQMNRHYKAADYYDKVELIRNHYPLASITTDIICGFPTESEEQYRETLEFVAKVGFADVHIFGYSRREGTRAAKLKPLLIEVVKSRCKGLEEVAARLKAEYESKFIGKPLEVLVEGESGYSREYIKIDNLSGNSGDIIEVIYNKQHGVKEEI